MTCDSKSSAAALVALDQLTRKLRKECPWDREQDERSIVPHTVEESYELAEAVESGDDRKLIDELGDVLYQVHLLSLMLEERGAGSLREVAESCHRKLIHRHPHIFGHKVAGADDLGPATTASEVRENWDRIKKVEPGRESGPFADVPEKLPGLLFARKLQRRAAATGFDHDTVPFDAIEAELAELESAENHEDRFNEIGDVLFSVVNVARKLNVDPELAIRSTARRFVSRILHAIDLANHRGRSWEDLSADEQLQFYALSKFELTDDSEEKDGRGEQD